jgi:hypothetical protein
MMRTQKIGTLLGLLIMLNALASCSNLPEKRNLLAAAGFKTLPATTPTQLAALHAMKAGKITIHSGENGPVYVFADPAKKSLMVGGSLQFKKYKTLKFQEQQADEKLLDAQVNMDNADYSAWGPDANFGYGVASDPL